MAIYINKKYDTYEEMMEEMTKCHEALVGSPAYVSSEIALCEIGENEFSICIGLDTEQDIVYQVNDWKEIGSI